ncbi:MAG: DUF4349 domain-containing protein [Candidatus Paceibacterota bacterium]|jgi:hypothetical protein|nr:DUF4349 domain-containing protein [Candidatus Paceibacterota bacterium]
MSLDNVQKFKKIFVFIVLGVLAVSIILSLAIGFMKFRANDEGISFNSSAPYGMMGKTASRGSIDGYISEEVMMPSFVPPTPASEPIADTDTAGGSALGDPVIVERKLMQDGNLSLVVSKVEKGVDTLSKVAVKFGGRVDSVSYQNADWNEKKMATVVLRVPAANFESAMSEIKSGARKVTSENISTRDVTEQFVDMQARLKTLKTTEEQYLEIMKKAVKIEDILSISRYLSDVRTQIEQLQGQMNYLSRQVDMSIITVYLTSEPEVDPGNVLWNPKTTALDAMRDFMQTIFLWGNIIIRSVLYYLPILILLGGVAYLAFLFYSKVLRPWYEASRDLFHF